MANVAAVFPLARRLENLVNTVNASEMWQAIVAQPDYKFEDLVDNEGGGDLDAITIAAGITLDPVASEAKIGLDCIYQDEDFEGSLLPPLINLRYAPGSTRTKDGTTTYNTNIQFIMEVHTVVPPDYQNYTVEALRNGHIDQLNKVGMILREIENVAPGPGYLSDISWDYLEFELYNPKSPQGWVRSAAFQLAVIC